MLALLLVLALQGGAAPPAPSSDQARGRGADAPQTESRDVRGGGELPPIVRPADDRAPAAPSGPAQPGRHVAAPTAEEPRPSGQTPHR